MFERGDGVSIRYEVAGEGEPLLLIGGFGTNADYWSDVMATGGLRFVSYDNRGVGRTVHGGAFTIQDLADDADALLGHLGIQRAHVLGWSMGAQVAMSLAASHPDRVGDLTLLGPFLRLPSRAAYVLGTLTSMALYGSAPIDCLAVAVNALCGTEAAFRAVEDAGGTVPVPEDPEGPEGLMLQLEAMRSWDPSAAASVSAPTLVVHGTEDIMVDPSFGREVADAIPGAGFMPVKGAGHAIPFHCYSEALRSLPKLRWIELTVLMHRPSRPPERRHRRWTRRSRRR